MQRARQTRGFTLIELMIVVAILGILLAIAVPAYQDFTIRARFAECLNAAAPLKASITEYVINGHVAGIANEINGIDALTPNCTVESALGGLAGFTLSNRVAFGAAEAGGIAIMMTPSLDPSQGAVSWQCTTVSGERWVPAACR